MFRALPRARAMVSTMKALQTFCTTVTRASGRPGTSSMPIESTRAGTMLASRPMTLW